MPQPKLRLREAREIAAGCGRERLVLVVRPGAQHRERRGVLMRCFASSLTAIYLALGQVAPEELAKPHQAETGARPCSSLRRAA